MVLVIRYWRETLIAALVLVVVGLCAHERHALIQQGIAQERSRLADSTLRVVVPQRLVHDTAVVHDTVRVRSTIARVDTLRDTVLTHLTDTVLVKEYVTRTDSALHACTELLNDCAAFRVSANQTIAALQSKLAVQPVTLSKSCTTPALVTGALGLVGGWLAHRK
jgi:hypothetical protein